MTEIKRFSLGSLPLRDVRVSEWRLPRVGFSQGPCHRKEKMRKSVDRKRTSTATPMANLFAKLVLEILDLPYFRCGRALEYIEPVSSGLVSIQKDHHGCVRFRTPRGLDKSVRLEGVDRQPPLKGSVRLEPKKGSLLFKTNPISLSFMNEECLREEKAKR
jgi:hypothetical protein